MLVHVSTRRFTFLTLGEGEHYYESFKVDEIRKEEGHVLEIPGRLHFCSHSLIFVPEKLMYPLVKLKYNKFSGSRVKQKDDNRFQVHVTEYVLLKKHNKHHPYIRRKTFTKFLFRLQHTPLEKFLHKLLPILTIHSRSQSHLKIQELLRRKYYEDYEKLFLFDITYFDDFREQKLYENMAMQIKPLIEIRGKMVLTDKTLYFQPFHKLGKPVEKIKFQKIKKIMRRRYLLQHIGLEIFLADQSRFFVFENRVVREKFYTEMTKMCGDDKLMELRDMTKRWQNGKVSNFDYLLYLNFLGDRSFNDLTQYPVFPWVLKDYKNAKLDLLDEKGTYRDLSKPIGALNEKRLTELLRRYEQMPSPKFLYGSHYSTPFMVLYYLVRQAPEYMLRLQAGRFDDPDRLFHSIHTTWSSVTSNQTDLKELIPEFFQSSGAFLRNSDSLNLGIRSSGAQVNDVVLPPWAVDCKDFVYKNRLALESEYVSSHLHEWIDLIFGELQRGQKAVDANNLFHHLTYEGNINFDEIKDPVDRASYQSQIREFGQCPKQLFTKEHPRKIVIEKNVEQLIEKYDVTNSDVIGFHKVFMNSKEAKKNKNLEMLVEMHSTTTSMKENVEFGETDNNNEVSMNRKRSSASNLKSSDVVFNKFSPKLSNKLHRGLVSSIQFDGAKIICSSHDSSVRIFSMKRKRQTRRITNFGDMALSKCCFLPTTQQILVSSWNNFLYLYSVGYGRLINFISCHDDAISNMCVSNNGTQVATSSWDGTVKIFDLKKKIQDFPALEYDEHNNDEVSCVAFGKVDGNSLISGDRNGCVVIYDVRKHKAVFKKHIHDSNVNSVQFLKGDKRIVSCGNDKSLKVYDFRMEREISLFESKFKMNCCKILPTEKTKLDGELIVTGNDNGFVQFWDVNNSGNCLMSLDSKTYEPITSIQFNDEMKLFATGHKSGKIVIWEP